jgi:hypothetical protein
MLRSISTSFRSSFDFIRAVTMLSLVALISFCLPSVCLAASANGFISLREGDCKPITETLQSSLPPKWDRYLCCVKVCSVKANDAVAPSLFVVSIWTQQFYHSMSPETAETAEAFPLPLILDKDLKVLGELPEIFPLNDVTSPQMSFGRWSAGKPREIRIDVSSPAVEGDYFYPPMQWDEKKGRYVMRGKGVTYGRRH